MRVTHRGDAAVEAWDVAVCTPFGPCVRGRGGQGDMVRFDASGAVGGGGNVRCLW